MAIWTTRRDAPPAFASDLRRQLEVKRQERDTLVKERADVEEGFPSLVVFPEKLAAAEARLREIDAALPSKDRTIKAIEDEIPKAEQREKNAAILARRDDLDRRSAKLAKGLSARYQDAASTLAEILKALDADADEWRAMNVRLNEIGELGGQSAEERARAASGVQKINPTFYLTRQSCVLGWSAAPLFDGGKTSWN